MELQERKEPPTGVTVGGSAIAWAYRATVIGAPAIDDSERTPVRVVG